MRADRVLDCGSMCTAMSCGRMSVQVEVAGPEAALEVLRRGARLRQKAATALNYASSRSHSVFSVLLCRRLAPAPSTAAPAPPLPSAASSAATEALSRAGARSVYMLSCGVCP